MANTSERLTVNVASSIGWDVVAGDTAHPKILQLEQVSVFYGRYEAVRDTTMEIGKNQITAIIGPSGCGKTTILRALNRMNDLIPGARVARRIAFHGTDLYAPEVDPIQVRRRIGMVFQKPNPFPKSVYDNVAYGPRVTAMPVESMDDLVEEALRRAAPWDEAKDKLKSSA